MERGGDCFERRWTMGYGWETWSVRTGFWIKNSLGLKSQETSDIELECKLEEVRACLTEAYSL